MKGLKHDGITAPFHGISIQNYFGSISSAVSQNQYNSWIFNETMPSSTISETAEFSNPYSIKKPQTLLLMFHIN